MLELSRGGRHDLDFIENSHPIRLSATGVGNSGQGCSSHQQVLTRCLLDCIGELVDRFRGENLGLRTSRVLWVLP